MIQVQKGILMQKNEGMSFCIRIKNVIDYDKK